MTNRRLFMVHGTGRDSVGLVGNITAPIAQVGGSVVDLRQDVLHGLFTIFLVVDLTDSSVDQTAFSELISRIAERTGLRLAVEKYTPIPRNPDKRNMLMVLLGTDAPGIIATISEILGKYKVNIEFAQNIGRGGVFLMELLTDISNCMVPLENLREAVDTAMKQMNIRTIFQGEDVFNKKKRVIIFEARKSVIGRDTLRDILNLTGISPELLTREYSSDRELESVQKAVRKLEGLPIEVLDSVIADTTAISDTTELIQTLKTMGYKVALISSALSFVTDYIASTLGIDHSFGLPAVLDDDTRSITGELHPDALRFTSTDRVVSRIMESEGITPEDITIVSDRETDIIPGIRFEFGMERLLENYNSKAVNRENLIGILGSFGVPNLD